MIIKSIELDNIRSYKQEKIDFLEGINFLSGDIGSGKSSILQAIEFAFFGFKRQDLEGFQLLRKGELKGSVKLTLEDNDQTIEIFRSLKKSKTTETISQENGYIKVNENLEELSPQELNLHIFKILSFPESFIRKDKNLVYRFTIYTPQEQLKEILFSDNDTRLELIRKIFGIDKYKQLINAISVYMSKVREDKKVLNSKLEPQIKLEEELKEINKESEIISKNLKENISRKKELDIKKEKYSDGLKKREELENKIKTKVIILEKNLSKLEQIKNQTEELNNELKYQKEDIKYFNKNDLEKEIKELLSKDKKLKDEIKSNEKNKIKLEKEILEFEKLKEKINIVNNKKEVIKSKKKSFDLMLTKCRVHDTINKIKKIESNLKSLEKKEKEYISNNEEITKLKLELENLDSKKIDYLTSCPTCLQDISKDHKKNIQKEVSQKKKEIDSKINLINKKFKDFDESHYSNLKENLIKSNQNLENFKIQEKEEISLNKEIEKEEKEIKNLEKEDLEINNENSLRETINKLNKKEIELNSSISDIKINILNLENKSKNLDKIKDEILVKEEKIQKNETILKKKDLFENQLEILNNNLSKINSEEKNLNDVLEKIYLKEKELITSISSDETKQLSFEKRIKVINNDLDHINKVKEELNNLLENENFLSKDVVKISSIIEKVLFTKFYIEFTEEFEFIFKELIEDNSFEVRLDEEFSPIIEQNGYDIGIKNLSGGEKSSLAIAYRLGLKKIIENNFTDNKLSLLILDEPTDGFSSQQVDRLGYLLKETHLKQIILVSHDDKIESISDTILHVEKLNHESKVI